MLFGWPTLASICIERCCQFVGIGIGNGMWEFRKLNTNSAAKKETFCGQHCCIERLLVGSLLALFGSQSESQCDQGCILGLLHAA